MSRRTLPLLLLLVMIAGAAIWMRAVRGRYDDNGARVATSAAAENRIRNELAFDPETTIDVNGTRVFDHSRFGVSIRNTSNRMVEIESARLTSRELPVRADSETSEATGTSPPAGIASAPVSP